MKRTAIITTTLMLAMAGFAQTMKSITFGSYPQQNDTKESIEWLVLQEKEGQMLLVSRYCLASLPWHNQKTAVTWDVSDIRRWLNGEFLETAFSKTEQAAIVRTHLDNRDQLGNGTPVGADTEDRIFLLNAIDALVLLYDEGYRVKPTPYAISQGVYVNQIGDCAWWLRSPGKIPTSPSYFNSHGDIGTRNHEVQETIIGVRPALWVNKENIKTANNMNTSNYKSPRSAEERLQSKNPEGMQKVVDAIKDCHYYFIATVDGDQPQVRPFSSFDIYEGNVYILTGHKKNVGKQIDTNPKVAIAAFNGKNLVRITATLVEAKDRETRAAIIAKNPMFANDYSPDDDNTAVYFLTNAVAKLGQETINF